MKLNRRDFLRTSAAATFALGSLPLVGAQTQAKQYRTVIIGTGWWGMNILGEAMASGRSRVVAMCDVDERLLQPAWEKVKKLTGAEPQRYRDYRELLEREKPEICIVATPDHWHPLQTIAAVKAGAHVYVEKQGVQDVYHLAGMISILPGKNQLVWRVNVEGTRNVIAACVQAGVRRLVYTSSIHAITRTPHGVTIDETLPFDPSNACGEYDRSKAAASLEVLKAVEQGMDAVIVSPTGVIGPYDFRGSQLGQLVGESLGKKPLAYVDGAYDFVDVRDVVQGMILANDRGRPGENYILSGELLTVRGLLDTLAELRGRKLQRWRIPMWLARLGARFTPVYYRWAHKKQRGITPQVQFLVRKLMEDECRDVGVAAAQLRAEYRVAEPAERRVGNDARYTYIQPVIAQLAGKLSGTLV